MKMLKKFRLEFDWPFIKKALKVLVPVVLSSVVLVAVSFVDNIMVNSFKRPGMPAQVDYAAVGMAGELWFSFQAFYIGVSVIFAVLYAQFVNQKKLFVDVARFNFWYLLIVSTTVSLVMFFLNEQLVDLFFLGGENPDDIFIKPIAYDYLKILSLGQLFIAFAWAILNPLTIKGKTNYMLYSSLLSIGANALLDYLFIYVGNQGAQGSAWATVISYALQLLLAIFFAWRHWEWFVGFWKLFTLNKFVTKEIIKRTYMLFSVILMQIGFAFSTVIIVNLYSTKLIRPLTTAYMVSSIMFTIFQATNRGAKVFIGPLLGDGKFAEAKAKTTQLWYANLILIFIFVALSLITASFFPQLMLQNPEEINIARSMIFIFAGALIAYAISAFFGGILETGGHQLVQNLWNYFFQLWASLPMLVLCSHLVFDLPFIWNFFISQFIFYIPATIIYFDYRRFKWLRTIKE